jgi:hypothetical protein
MSDISLTVLDDMRLMISPAEVARDAEHNSAMFKITQPPALDQYACRAEVETAGGMTYRAVTAGEFALTNDIAVRGLGRLQLVYSDGVDVMRKTSVAAFHVTGSLNALDQSDPDFQDGLAQVQGRCFADANLVGMTLNFYNLGGQLVGSVTSPAGGIEEVPAGNGAYARVRSGSTTSWQDFATMRVAGLDSPQFAGSPTTSPTPLAGDSSTRLANTQFVARDFLPRAGGQMSGPLITMMGGSPTNPGIGIGDNTTGFYRSGNLLVTTLGGAIVAQVQPTIAAYFIPLDMGNQRLSSVADATLAQDALNRRTADARYLQAGAGGFLPTSGGSMTGDIHMIGTAGPVVPAKINFYTRGASLAWSEPDNAMVFIKGTGNAPLYIKANDGSNPQPIIDQTLGDFRYGRAPSFVLELPGNQTFTTAAYVSTFPITFPIPRGGNSRIMVSVVLDCTTPGDQQIAIAGVRCDMQMTKIQKGWVYQINGECTGVNAQFVFDVAGTSVGPFNVQCANLTSGATGGAVSWTALAGSYVVVTDLGPR